MPFHVGAALATGGSAFAWTTNGAAAAPVGHLAWNLASLPAMTASGIVVLTMELLRAAGPAGEAAIREEMIAAMVEFLDAAFIDPTNAGTSEVAPAAITNGVAGTAASGTTAAAARADLAALLGGFAGAGYRLSESALIMADSVFVTLALLLGDSFFAVLDRAGLSLVLSPAADDNIVVAHMPSILYADDGNMTLDVARHASLKMDDAPDGTPGSLVSLWQANAVAMKAHRTINWSARSGAVDRITGVAYA